MKEITTQAELDALTAQGPVVVDFWAPWCGPCRMLTPVLEEASQADDGVTYVKCNIDSASQFASEMQIGAIPTLKFFKKGGTLSESNTGVLSLDAIQEKASNLLTE